MNRFLTLLGPRKNKKEILFEKGFDAVAEGRADDLSPVIMVVESVDFHREQLCRIIGSRYRLVVAGNASSALDTLSRSKAPDLIVCDSHTTSMSGNELCAKLKAGGGLRHIPFIMLCSDNEGYNRLSALESGADACLTKPLSAGELMLSIRNLLHTRIDVSKMYDSPAIAERDADDNIHPKDRKFLHKLTGIILQEISNPRLNVDMLTKKMGYSRTGLFTKIKSITGMCPNDFINDFRFKMAAQMILEGTHNLQSIAEETGFSSNSYFSKAFKKHFGVSPKDYKG